jgi:hypothetical protein
VAGGVTFHALQSVETEARTAIPADAGDRVLKQAADIAALKQKWDRLGELCQGGPGDDPLTDKACDAREQVSGELKQLGYCY